MRAVSVLLVTALSSLALAAPTPAQGARGSATNIQASVQNANVAVLRFDNAVQNVQTPDSTSVQPGLRAGTMAVSVIQQASSEVSQEGRTGIQGAPVAMQAIVDFSSAMNKAADDLVSKRNIIITSGQDGLFLDVYVAQANAGMELMQGVMDAMPPRERGNAAQALAAIPAGIDKVRAAFPPSNATPAPAAALPPPPPPPAAAPAAAPAPPPAQQPQNGGQQQNGGQSQNSAGQNEGQTGGKQNEGQGQNKGSSNNQNGGQSQNENQSQNQGSNQSSNNSNNNNGQSQDSQQPTNSVNAQNDPFGAGFGDVPPEFKDVFG